MAKVGWIDKWFGKKQTKVTSENKTLLTVSQSSPSSSSLSDTSKSVRTAFDELGFGDNFKTWVGWDGPNWSHSKHKVHRELVEKTVMAAFNIPLTYWQEELNVDLRGTEDYHVVYKATTERGATIVLDREYLNTTLYVDGESVGYYHIASALDDTDYCNGYKGIYHLENELEREMRRREEEPGRVAREAQEAMERRLKAERDAEEEKRARDILRRL
jgi:hypothetical protein